MTELQIWQTITAGALILLAGAAFAHVAHSRHSGCIRYRHLSGSERVYLYGDGITPGWYRLERPQAEGKVTA